MKAFNSRFVSSDTNPRKRHEVILTSDSPSDSVEMELLATEVVHTTPSEKALALNAATIVKEQPVEMSKSEKAAPVCEPVAEAAVSEPLAPVAEPAVETVLVAKEVKADPTKDEAVTAPVTEEKKAEAPKKKRRGLSLTERKALSGWLFVLPFVIGIIFVYAPIVWNSLAVSFSDYTPSQGALNLEWNNFANYKYLFAEDGDPYFSITIVDGIKDLLLQIPAIVIFALFMAIILNQKMTGRAVFRAIFFLPVILSTGIIDTIDTNSAFMKAVSNSQGGVDDNTGAESGGIMSAMDLENLLSGIKIGTELVTYVVNLVNNIFDIVSRSGVQMLIFLSGLQSISPAIYESCQVEGASSWETFWKITLPMISPMILVNAIYTVIDAFTAADNRVMIYIEKIYNRAEYGYSSAMSWIYVGVVLLFIILVALIMKTVVFYQRRD